MVQSLPGDRGMRRLPRPTEQRCSRLGGFSCKGLSQGCTVLGLQLLAILGDHGLPVSGIAPLC
ncbi:hypothetical protein QL093DRAFT_2552541 [Fusarium oxysporum]|nr:hypothetical protein QL093DRAFT_2552541 [Fusarium oxysporum]